MIWRRIALRDVFDNTPASRADQIALLKDLSTLINHYDGFTQTSS